MTDLVLTSVGDSWVHSSRPGQNYGSGRWAQVQASNRRALLRPELGNIAGRTVLDAYLVGRVGPGWVAQTLTVTPVTSRWSPGRVTWDNQPTVNSAAAVTLVTGALSDGATITVTGLAAIIQSVADGGAWYGLRITTSSSATGQKFYATDSGEPSWELHVVLSDAPEQPANLRPDGGGAVGGTTPILAWEFAGVGTDSSQQAEARVQIDTPAGGADPDSVTPDYDSGWLTNIDPQFVTAGKHTVSGGGPHYWRVQVRDADGNTSDWSDWADFTVAALPALVIDSPTGAFGDPTPLVTAHLTSGTVQAWSVLVTGPDRSDVRADSGVRTGVISWTVPERGIGGGRVLREDENGWIRVRVWDSAVRSVAVGQNTYVETWIQAAWTANPAVDPVTQLTVRQYADEDPRLVWKWKRTEAADAYLAQVDGVTVARIEPEDLVSSGGFYEWTDAGHVSPLEPHTLALRAIEGNGASEPVNFTNHVHDVRGVWLIPDDPAIAPIVLSGTGIAGFSRQDRVATYVPLTGPEVDVIYDHEGFRGTFEGTVDRRQDVWATLRDIEALAISPTRTGRQVWGSQTMRVRWRNVHATSADEITASNLLHQVRLEFVEVD